MRPGNIFDHVKFFLIFVSLQLFLFKNIVIAGYASCFVYLAYMLFLPIDFNLTISLLLAFFTGILMDMFYSTYGINAFACLVMAYIRPYVIKALTPTGGYDKGALTTMSYMGFVWYFYYVVPLVLTHHFIYFMLEAWHLRYFNSVLLQTLTSGLFTTLVVFLIQFFFPEK